MQGGDSNILGNQEGAANLDEPSLDITNQQQHFQESSIHGNSLSRMENHKADEMINIVESLDRQDVHLEENSAPRQLEQVVEAIEK